MTTHMAANMVTSISPNNAPNSTSSELHSRASDAHNGSYRAFTQRGWEIVHTNVANASETLKPSPIPPSPIPPNIASGLASDSVPGIAAQKTFHFKDFKTINAFLHQLTQTIVTLNHHPDIVFKPAQKTLFLKLTTHDANHTLSAKDITFVETLEQPFHKSSSPASSSH